MYYYILNPASGGGRINKIQERLKNRLKELGIAGEFVKSLGEGDVTKLTHLGIKKGYKTIVAVGGNGTINEVINGVGKSEVAVGIIPIGYKNELAKTLGIPDWQSACNILAARKIETLDIGIVGKSYFITSVNIGFEAEMAEKKPVETSLIHKTLYYKKALSWSSKFKPQKATLNLNDDYQVETDFFNIKVTNSRTFNHQEDKPTSLEILVTGKMSYGSSLKYIVNPDSLKQEKKPDLSLFRTQRAIINTAKPAVVSVDGKAIYKTPIAISISGRKLKIIVARKKGPMKQVKKSTPKKKKVLK